MPRSNFVPAEHAFRFPNRFVNTVFTFRFIIKKRRITTEGRCGGMAFSALDYYFAGMPIPEFTAADFPDASVPPDGHWLADYIYSRQIDTFKWRDSWRFVRWTRRSDAKVMSRTLHNEIPKVKESIDQGDPVTLGLIGASKLTSVGSGNHQVVCHGYEEESPGLTTLFIYDPNHPPTGSWSGEIAMTRRMGGGLGFEAERGGPWRGFFVQRYSRKRPPRPSGGGSGGGGGGGTGGEEDGRKKMK